MSAIEEHTPLEVLLNDPIMKHFNREFIEKCKSDLAQLRDDIDQAQERIAELGRMLDNTMQDAAELTAERDAARAQLAKNESIMIDATKKLNELRVQLATYQRREALRQ